jgi:aspartate aminotransferase-like enzyme
METIKERDLSLNPDKVLNMSVGQTDLHPAIRDILLVPLRTPAYFAGYREIQQEAERLAAQLLGTSRQPTIMLGLGRTGLEAGLYNLLPGDGKVLCIDNGTWGHFSGEIAENLGAQVTYLSSGLGADIAWDKLEEDLKNQRFDIVTVVHCETNTGARYDIQRVRHLIDKINPETLLMVDGISTFGGIEVKFDEWGIDYYVGGSQKCLNAPQGTPTVCYSERAANRISNKPGHRYLHTFAAYTKPTYLLIRGLLAVFQAIIDEGLENVYQRHIKASAAVRAGIQALGLDVFVSQPAIQSPSVTRIAFDSRLSARIEADREKNGIDGDCVTQMMMNDFGVVIGEDRIGTMGHFARPQYVYRTIEALGGTLKKLGYDVNIPGAISAAQKEFDGE